jgi:hypothetical protein
METILQLDKENYVLPLNINNVCTKHEAHIEKLYARSIYFIAGRH